MLQEHYRLFILLTPACIRTCMANRTHRVYLNQQCILIAVFFDRNDIQKIATLLTFRPKTVLGAAEKSHFTGFYRFVVSFFIHEAQHQHLSGICVLYDCRNKSVHFIKIHLGNY